MQRIVVVGNSGSGKTTLAARIAARLDLPHLELDSVNHLPDWVERDLAEFRDIVAEFAARDRWVIDGNYRSRVGDMVWSRADTVIWLDLPKSVVMWQMVRRTMNRSLRRTELWNGNRESFRNVLRWDPEVSIIRWAWTQHDVYRREYAAAVVDPANAAIDVVRLRSRPNATAGSTDSDPAEPLPR